MYHRRRDAIEPAPSSRSGRRVGYRFATMAALVRAERLSVPVAERIVDDWDRYVAARMREGRSPESTAEHIARFERQRLARPYPAQSRDPHARDARGRVVGRIGRPTRVSARGIPYKVCPRGTRLQSIVFPRNRYTPADARRWARTHDFPVRKLETTPNFVRIQLVPSTFFERGSFRNIELSERHGVRGIIGCPRVAVGGRSTRHGVRPVEVPRRYIQIERRRPRRVA